MCVCGGTKFVSLRRQAAPLEAVHVQNVMNPGVRLRSREAGSVAFHHSWGGQGPPPLCGGTDQDGAVTCLSFTWSLIIKNKGCVDT